jgi:hypothetical protein
MKRMNERTSHVGETLLFFGGPLIWAAHFFAVYGAETLFCMSATARRSAEFSSYALLGTLIAILALLVLLTRQLVQVGRSAAEVDEGEGTRFLRHGSILVATAALLALVWSAIPVIFLAACSAAAA